MTFGELVFPCKKSLGPWLPNLAPTKFGCTNGIVGVERASLDPWRVSFREIEGVKWAHQLGLGELTPTATIPLVTPQGRANLPNSSNLPHG